MQIKFSENNSNSAKSPSALNTYSTQYRQGTLLKQMPVSLDGISKGDSPDKITHRFSNGIQWPSDIMGLFDLIHATPELGQKLQSSLKLSLKGEFFLGIHTLEDAFFLIRCFYAILPGGSIASNRPVKDSEVLKAFDLDRRILQAKITHSALHLEADEIDALFFTALRFLLLGDISLFQEQLDFIVRSNNKECERIIRVADGLRNGIATEIAPNGSRRLAVTTKAMQQALIELKPLNINPVTYGLILSWMQQCLSVNEAERFGALDELYKMGLESLSTAEEDPNKTSSVCHLINYFLTCTGVKNPRSGELLSRLWRLIQTNIDRVEKPKGFHYLLATFLRYCNQSDIRFNIAIGTLNTLVEPEKAAVMFDYIFSYLPANDPKRTDILLGFAVALGNFKQWSTVLSACNKFLNESPQDHPARPLVQLRFAACLILKNDYKQASEQISALENQRDVFQPLVHAYGILAKKGLGILPEPVDEDAVLRPAFCSMLSHFDKALLMEAFYLTFPDKKT